MNRSTIYIIIPIIAAVVIYVMPTKWAERTQLAVFNFLFTMNIRPNIDVDHSADNETALSAANRQIENLTIWKIDKKKPFGFTSITKRGVSSKKTFEFVQVIALLAVKFPL